MHVQRVKHLKERHQAGHAHLGQLPPFLAALRPPRHRLVFILRAISALAALITAAERDFLA